MSTISTTTASNPFEYPGQSLLVRHPSGNFYTCLVQTSTANQYAFFRSTNSGTTWSLIATVTRANVVDLGQIFADDYGWLFWVYRTNESSQDRVYLRRLDTTTFVGNFVPSGETLIASAGNGGVAGTTYSGVDVRTNYLTSTGYHYIAVAAGTTSGSNEGVSVFGALIDPQGNCTVSSGTVQGTKQWLHAGVAGRVGVSIDTEHNGDGYTSSSPNLWVCYGRRNLKLVKLSWFGSGWSGSAGEVSVYNTTGDINQPRAAWDGSRFMMAIPDPVNTSQVMLFERDRANSTTKTYRTGVHTTGVVRSCTFAYDRNNGNCRVWAVGTSTAVLYACDFTRAGTSFSAWASTGLPAILGADNYGAKRSSSADAKWGLYTAASGAPNTLTYTASALSYSPNTPTWVSPNSGTAQDVGQPLQLDWAFSDNDPGDTQSAFAVSRQIGSGSLSYWRASDSTWQVAEVQNSSGSTLINLPIAWGGSADLPHTYKAKVWDSNNNVSSYSAGLQVIASVPVNPSITSPTAAQVLGTSTVGVTWTATEQTAYRLLLENDPGNALNANPNFETDATSWTPTGATFVRSTAQFHQGAASGLLTPDGVTATVEVVTEQLTATMAEYRFSSWVRCAVSRNVNVGFNWYDASAAFMFSTLETFAVVANTWTFIDMTYSAPSGTGFVKGKLQMTGTPAASNTLFIDQSRVSGAVVYDSGYVNDTLTRIVNLPVVFTDATAWMVALYTKNLEGLNSQASSRAFTVSFTPPATPTLVATPMPANGIIRVVITNPTPSGGQPAVATQELYRRAVGLTSNGVRVATSLVSGATVDDWQAISGVNYEYRVHTIGTTGVDVFGAWTQ